MKKGFLTTSIIKTAAISRSISNSPSAHLITKVFSINSTRSLSSTSHTTSTQSLQPIVHNLLLDYYIYLSVFPAQIKYRTSRGIYMYEINKTCSTYYNSRNGDDVIWTVRFIQHKNDLVNKVANVTFFFRCTLYVNHPLVSHHIICIFLTRCKIPEANLFAE
jgi:hypothetical protein